MIGTKYPMVSTIPSADLPAPGIVRQQRGANPVNTSRSGTTRETAPISGSATPRVQHPALNSLPWSTSYAQPRSEPKQARAVGKRNANKRMKSAKRNKKVTS
jgi:hypothetical protein